MGNPAPGTVLVLDRGTGKLTPSERPYDTGVAGVISGAGTLRPGIVLGRSEMRNGRAPRRLAEGSSRQRADTARVVVSSPAWAGLIFFGRLPRRMAVATGV
jgi:hypothetical protein